MPSFSAAYVIPALAAGILLAAGHVTPAQAAVNSISLKFTDQYETGVILEPEVTCTTKKVEIETVEWNKDVEDWKPGSRVTATIRLSSDEGFKDSYNSDSLKISGASFSSARNEDGYLEITARYYPVVELASPEEAGWSRLNKTKATWKKVEYATGYQVRLYRDNDYIRTIDTQTNSVDLSGWMTSDAYYYYEVRAIGKDRSDAKYRKASKYTESSNLTMEDMGDVGGRWRNFNEGKKYQREDGAYAVNGWQMIVGKWYLFDENGYMVTGWKNVNGCWYYMNEDGSAATGWLQIGDRWYYMDQNGAMITGWKETTPSSWYYFYDDGSMAVNTVIDGCTLDGSGRWVQ